MKQKKSDRLVLRSSTHWEDLLQDAFGKPTNAPTSNKGKTVSFLLSLALFKT